MEKMHIEDKHLMLEHKELGQCFMKLSDILEILPKFRSKQQFEMIDNQGRPTTERYVKCDEVKSLVSEKIWMQIHSEIFYDWFRLGKDSKNAIRLILTK